MFGIHLYIVSHLLLMAYAGILVKFARNLPYNSSSSGIWKRKIVKSFALGSVQLSSVVSKPSQSNLDCNLLVIPLNSSGARINRQFLRMESATAAATSPVVTTEETENVDAKSQITSAASPAIAQGANVETDCIKSNLNPTEAPSDVDTKAIVDTERRDWPWKKAKKVAVMISFCGKDYIGMQRNPGFKTIEEELMKAFRDSGCIPGEWFDNMQQAYFQRASRTDKGVSAAKMIISLRLIFDGDMENTVRKINTFLPSEIRVHAIKRVTKNFNSKTACDARTYLYMMPTFAFAPIFPSDIPAPTKDDSSKNEVSNVVEEHQQSENGTHLDKQIENENSSKTDTVSSLKAPCDIATNGDNLNSKTCSDIAAVSGDPPIDYITKLDYRISPEVRTKVNEVLKSFIGAHYFHNYTSGKLPLEPSSQRFIYTFECGEPFIRSGMEFVIVKVKGQSFMLHQIRKMIGMTIAVVRGHASVETIEKTWGLDRIDVPRAPGLGLLLEEVHYDRYNKRFGKDGFHENLSWTDQVKDVEDFKEKFIYPEMIDGEVKEFSMFEWLKFLPIHTFTPRHFESDDSEIAERPLYVASKRVGRFEDSRKNGSKKSKRDVEVCDGDDDE